MKITEIHKAILDTLRDKKFVGDFVVTISHNGVKDVEINGHIKDTAMGCDFNRRLQNNVNEICYKIVSGVTDDGDFTFDIKGQIEYMYEYKE